MTIAPCKEGHILLIPGTLRDGNFEKIKRLPGYFRWQDRNVIVRAIGANIEHVLNTWPDAIWLPEVEPIREGHLVAKEQAAEASRIKTETGRLTCSDYKFQREPMEHQLKAFLLSRDRESFGLFMEQGTGKTKVIIDNACYLYQQGKIELLIIVAWPNGVHRNWIEYELPADMSVPYTAEYWSANHKTKQRRVALRKLILEPERKLRVMTFNVEAFTSEDARAYMLELLGSFRTMLVIDQSASIKNPQALRTKFLINKCSEQALYRRVLDGAPVAEGADELYSQFKFLDPNIIGHDTWTGFKAEFCKIGYFREIVGFVNLDELRRRIDGYCYRVLASECQDLPERTYKPWPFELSVEEQRIFDDLKKEGLAFFKGGDPFLWPNDPEPEEEEASIEEHLAMVKNMRLQQISSGWWPEDDDFKSIEKVPSRLQALLRLLEQAEGKALIFARFRADLKLIQETLGKEAVSYHGGIGEEQRGVNKKKFMTDPKVKYFIGQPRSAGIGHTLTAARHVIFYSNDPSLRLREECEKRAHRQGQKHNLIVWDLVARKSHDAKIVRALREKKKLSNIILQDPDQFFLEYA